MKVTAPKKLTDYKYLNLFSVHWNNRGKEGDWIFASRKKKPTLGKKPLKSDAVMIVPIHIDEEDNRRLVMLRQYRIPLGDYEYAFPAGLVEGDVLDDAVRELKEETGLEVTNITEVSPAIVSSAGLSDESVVVVFCECKGKISHDGNEATEEIETLLLNYKDMVKLCDSNKKISAKTWPILFMYKRLGYVYDQIA